MADDLLEMKLHDISDLLLQNRCETGKDVSYVECKGTSNTGERVILTVCLRGDTNE